MRGLANKIVVITGGCGELGAATARRLSAEGAKPVLLDILDEPAAQDIAAGCGAAAYFKCDHSDRAGVERVFAAIAKRFGRIDVAIANAAMVRACPFVDITPECWDDYLRVNLTGSFYVAQSAARIQVKQELDANGVRGKILFTSSWT